MKDIYVTLNKNLETLKRTQTRETYQHIKQHKFQERSLNLTQREFSQDGLGLLNLGWNYAIERPIADNVRQIVIETEKAIEQLDTHLRSGYRILVHKKLKQILNNQKHNLLHKRQYKTLKHIKQKLELHILIVIRADKGKSN
jgi:hypothetical protein